MLWWKRRAGGAGFGLGKRFFSSLILDTKCSNNSSSSAISTDVISSKCDYVKALYGFTQQQLPPTSSYLCRMRQAVTVALQNFLHFRRGVPLDDAVFISTGAPRYVDNYVHRIQCGDEDTRMNYEQVRSKAESVMQKEGVDEMEPFLESIGVTSSQVEIAGDLCGDQGLLRTAKALESRGIPKKIFWNLLRHNMQLLSYSLRDFLDACSILEDLGMTRENIGRAVELCPWAFRVEMEEEMKPVIEQLRRVGLDKTLIARIILEAPTKLKTLKQLNLDALVSAIEQVGVSKEATLRVIQVDPIVIVGTSIEKLMQLISYLKTALLLEDEEVVSLITRFPRVLVLNLDKSIVKKMDYLKGLGVERAYIKRMMLKTPQMLAFSLEDNLKPKVEFLESIGFRRKSLANLLSRHPELLNDIVSNCLRRKANFLLHQGVPSSRLADLFFTYPQFVALKMDHVKQRLEFYRRMKVDYLTLGSMIVKHPAIMSHDVEEQVKPILDYLKLDLAFNAVQLIQFLKERPSVLGESVEFVSNKVKYFEKLGFRRGSDAFNEVLVYGLAVPESFMDTRLDKLRSMGITEAQLKELLQIRMPLLYSDDQRMLSSTEYLLKEMNLSMDFLLKFPQFFGYSLEERIKPRHRLIAFLKAKHVVRQDYPPAYLHLGRYKFEELFLDAHPHARDVYTGIKEPLHHHQPLLLV